MADGIEIDNPEEAGFIGNWQEADQAKHRRYQRYKDQHGRDWGAPIEVRPSSTHPCGPFEPLFDAPIYPPNEVIKMTQDFGQLRIDYGLWEDNVLEMWADRDKQKRKLITRLYPAEDFERVWDAETRELQIHLGPEPSISVEVVRACRAANPWVMGVPGAEKPKAALKWFPEEPEVIEIQASPEHHDAIRDPWATEEDKMDAELRDLRFDEIEDELQPTGAENAESV